MLGISFCAGYIRSGYMGGGARRVLTRVVWWAA